MSAARSPAPMHVVFFNRSFYPDTAATGQILTDLCEDLVQVHGFQVTVISGMPLLSVEGAGHVDRVAARERYRGIDVVRARGTRLSKARFIGRAMNYVTYFLSACGAGLRIRRPDVVISLTDPPIIGLAGWLTSRWHRVPLIMAYQDLFPEVAVLLEDFQSDLVNSVLQRVNELLCRKATRIVALGETMRERLVVGKGAAREKTLVIPSGADTQAVVPGPKRNSFSEAHGLVDKFVVMHSGNIGLSQSLETLIDAATILRDVHDIQFVFQGDGVKRADLEAQAIARGLGNVMFLPFQPKDRLAESFAAADLFVVSLQAGLAGYIVPSKLYGILAAGRPYVAAVEDACEVAAITRSHDCGVVARPGDPRDLADKILSCFHDPDANVRRGANARAAGVSFDRRLQVAKYADLCREVAGTTRGSHRADVRAAAEAVAEGRVASESARRP